MTTNWYRLPGSVQRLFWLVTSFILCISLVLSATLSALAINPFIKHTESLNLGGLRFVSDAWVIQDNGTYKMWFTHPGPGFDPESMAGPVGELDLNGIMQALKAKDMDALLNHFAGLDPDVIYDLLKDSATVIGYATSANGIDWTIENTVVLSATAELQNVAAPCVIKVNGTYHMWYSRSTTEYTRTELAALLNDLQGTSEQRIEAITTLIENNQAVIDYATSTDGEVWVPQPDSVLEGAGVYLGDNVGSPSVLFDGTDYHMWFSNVSTEISQNDIEDLINNIETITPADLFELQAGVNGSIGYATSTDGISWNIVNRSVFSNGSGILNAVAAPCVIGDSINGFEMWYTYGVTDFNENDIDPILDELSVIDINQLISLLEAKDYDGLIDALTQIIDYEIDETRARLAGTTTRIGYAVSTDGISWVDEDPYALTGFAETPWSGVGRPCVIKTGGVYEIWFTKGIDELTAQNLVDLWQGTISTIGYASSSSLVAETSTRMAIDGDGVVVVELIINRVKDAATGDTVTDYGGITGFRVSLDVEPAGGVEMVDVRAVAPFSPLDFVDKDNLEFYIYGVDTPLMPEDSVVAKLVLRLIGDAVTPFDVTIKFDSIRGAEPAGLNIPTEDMDAMVFLRGDATGDGVVNILDALIIAQYRAGMVELFELNAINAASTFHDSAIAGDLITILDALAIAQYRAGILDEFFNTPVQ